MYYCYGKIVPFILMKQVLFYGGFSKKISRQTILVSSIFTKIKIVLATTRKVIYGTKKFRL